MIREFFEGRLSTDNWLADFMDVLMAILLSVMFLVTTNH